MMNPEKQYYIALISIHGLIRGHNLELGRDADTGGQTKYVVELANALGQHPDVLNVDLFTRKVSDPHISSDYNADTEQLSGTARIVRLPDGVAGYLPKEQLWDLLDNYADNLLNYFQEQGRFPDLIHSHYADAGYVGSKIANILGIPLVHTGHSLGRIKRRRLLASGLNSTKVEEQYNMTRRINAEEETLETASLVITSTHQEIEQQYGYYDFYQPKRMRVIPPGTDLSRFKPPGSDLVGHPVYDSVARFLHNPNKPMILALSRPDQRKNIHMLVEAYGESNQLQEMANLVIIAGNRDDIREMDEGAQEVLTDLLLTIDQYNLYGKVAYPKHHNADDVPVFYQLATESVGIFINPALTEPFGLTLIEAAACGLPIVATDDGGPRDIIKNCKNGYLIDPLDKKDIEEKLLKVLKDHEHWQEFSTQGLEGVKAHYSWPSHVERYIKTIRPIIDKTERIEHLELSRRSKIYHDRALFSDLDQNLLGDPDALPPFIKALKDNEKCVSFGIATGRRLDSALQELKRYNIPTPDVLITSLGTEIYYAPNLTRDTAWSTHIDHLWMPKTIRRLMQDIPGIKLQPKNEQTNFKISYYINPKIAPSIEEITSLLHQNELSVNVIHSFGQFLDIVPIRANKGYAIRWYATQWNIPLDHMLIAGGSGADEDMMRGNTLAVVVANRHEEELSDLIDSRSIYFAREPYAHGILEAIKHFDFFKSCKIP